MTAAQLIEYLQSVPPDTLITVWLDGDRYDFMEEDPFDYWDDDRPEGVGTAEHLAGAPCPMLWLSDGPGRS